MYCFNGLHFCYNFFNGLHFCNNFFNGLHSLNFGMNFFHGLINCLNSFMNNCFRYTLMNNLLDWLNCLKCDWLNCRNLGNFDLHNWNLDLFFIFDCLNYDWIGILEDNWFNDCLCDWLNYNWINLDFLHFDDFYWGLDLLNYLLWSNFDHFWNFNFNGLNHNLLNLLDYFFNMNWL